ncbi:hypothetical protein [Klebsiella pneumoniae]|uniref:hypothetical protein n=1 Tax=Klebsiella pneumoniae TaxID=573 RepID=UPI0040453548
MTKSTITREQLIKKAQEQIEFCRHTKITGEGRAHVNQCAALFEIALAAMDSEPDRNPVLAYADSYRDMAKQGVWSVPIWSVITDLERNIAPLYRHAQPVPVVSADLLHSAASAIEDLLTTKDRTGAGVWFDLPFRLRSAANAQPAPVVPEEKPIPNTLSMYAVDAVAAIAEVKGWNACRSAMLSGGKS